MNEWNEQEIRRIVRQVVASGVGAAERSQVPCPPLPVEVSARHVHLNEEAARILFGDSTLTKKRDLSQPGEFLSQQRVKIVTAKGEFSNVAVLGPLRSAVQVELSATDCRTLGIQAPVNLSGDLSGAADVLLIGTHGVVKADGSAIVAKAHIHMTPEDARRYAVENGQRVAVRLNSPRPVTLEDVAVRVSPNYALMVHIDFDEANASMAGSDTTAGLLLSQGMPAGANPATCPAMDAGQTAYDKKLMTEADARELVKMPGEIRIFSGTIVTPAARDVLNQHRRTLVTDGVKRT